MTIALIGAAVAVASAALAAAWPAGDDKRAALARRFAFKVDLDPRPDLVQALGRRLVRRARIGWGTYGVALGVLIAVASSTPAVEAGSAIWILGFWAVVQLGRGLGAMTVQALDDNGGERRRAAHLASPSLLDFVTSIEVWWTRAGALAALAVAAWAALGADGAHRGAALAVLAACAIGWALIEVAVLVVLRARPVASDVQSLAFDDALRAESLRGLLFALSFPLFAVADAADGIGLPANAFYVLLGGFLVTSIPLGWADSSRRAKQRFRRRLWAASPADRGA